MMTKINISVEQCHDIAKRSLLAAGCDEANATAIADVITAAERDRCHSHGLFRLAGYIGSLKSGKANGRSKPQMEQLAPAVLRCDGDYGYSPLAQQISRTPLAECARETGIAALAITRTHHFQALWYETSALAEMGLCAMAFTAYMPTMAPAGGTKPFFGTNPMAFAWPRQDKPPMVFDQASSAMARGEIQIAAREGHGVPPGTGIDAEGKPTTDPAEILKGAQLPFGGYKGSAIALMIELLVGPLIGEMTSPAARRADNGDGGPATGGELMIAIDPQRYGNAEGWKASTEALFEELLAQEGTRLPSDRRYRSRKETPTAGIDVPAALIDTIRDKSGIEIPV